MKKINVLLPTYNSTRWLREAISSVASEAVAEILVLDDGSSTENLVRIRNICAEYSNVRLFSLPHRGIAETLNYGISISSTPYIARMDSDDISLPERLSLLAQFLDKNPEVAVVGCQIMDIDENGQWAEYKRKPYPLAADSIRLSLLSGKCLIQHPSVMMRRTAIEKVGGYDPSMEGAEDYDLWLRLSRTMPIRNIDTVLLHYRRHSCQVSTEHNVKQKQARDKALVRAILLDVCSDQNISKLSMQSAYEAIDGIFGIVARIREGKPVTRLQWFILGSALSMGLIGEGNGFKRRLIRKLQVNQQDLSKVTFYFLFFYLRLMLLKSTTSRINSKAVASLLDRLPDQIRA